MFRLLSRLLSRLWSLCHIKHLVCQFWYFYITLLRETECSILYFAESIVSVAPKASTVTLEIMPLHILAWCPVSAISSKSSIWLPLSPITKRKTLPSGFQNPSSFGLAISYAHPELDLTRIEASFVDLGFYCFILFLRIDLNQVGESCPTELLCVRLWHGLHVKPKILSLEHGIEHDAYK